MEPNQELNSPHHARGDSASGGTEAKTRIALGVLLGVLALASASTSRTFQGRTVYHNVSGDVKEVSPVHWTGPWKTVGVNIDDVRQAGEE